MYPWRTSAKKSGNQFEIMITDRHSKLTRAIMIPNISSSQDVYIFLKHWILSYSVSDIMLSANVDSFHSKGLTSLLNYLRGEKTATTSYHPQTNGQVKCYAWMHASRSRLYVTDNQITLDLSIHSLPYAYSFQSHSSSNGFSFSRRLRDTSQALWQLTVVLYFLQML